MTRFAYTARERSGALRQGEVEAADRSGAALRLVRHGLFVSSLEEHGSSGGVGLGRLFRRRAPKRDLAAATRQLSSLLEGGLPLVSALEVLAREISHRELQDVLLDVSLRVEEGRSLSSALAEHPRTFTGVYTNMVASGETIGRLPEVLRSIADRLEAEDEIRKKVRMALIYPAVLLVAGTLTTILLVTFVIPRLVALFEDMDQSLPLPTRILVGVSHATRSYGWLLLPILVMAGLALRSRIRRPAGRARMHALALRLPVLGRLFMATEIERFSRTMATLLRSGLSLLIALEVVESTASVLPFRSSVRSLRRDVAEGLRLSQAMRKSGSFSLSTAHVVAVGEDANDPATALEKVADTHRREVEEATRVLTTLIEPALVVTVGLIVGFIVFAMMLPIFQIDISGIER